MMPRPHTRHACCASTATPTSLPAVCLLKREGVCEAERVSNPTSTSTPEPIYSPDLMDFFFLFLTLICSTAYWICIAVIAFLLLLRVRTCFILSVYFHLWICYLWMLHTCLKKHHKILIWYHFDKMLSQYSRNKHYLNMCLRFSPSVG